MPSVPVNGVKLFYELAGPADASVIVFSNSLGATLEMWDGVIADLAKKYRCLRYDTRGHGRSGSADVPVTVDDLADDLISLLDALDITRVHIIGLSIGSMTGLAAAERYPDRLATLTAVATSAWLPPAEFWLARAATVRADGPAAVIEALLPRWFTPGFRQRSPQAVEDVRRHFLSNNRAGYARCCEAIGHMDLRARLHAIVVPTLVIAGSEDPVTTPAMCEAVRAGVSGARLVTVPGVSHLISVERPEAIAVELHSFLGQKEGRYTHA